MGTSSDDTERTGRGGSGWPGPDAWRVWDLGGRGAGGMGVQNLRAYEARGLLDPERTQGGTRRYSADDLERLRRIGHLLDAGLNLAGIAMVMQLQDENTRLREESV